MVATKHERIEDATHLGLALETLLSQYEASTGSPEGGVPATILQTATRIPSEHAPMQQAGPSDAVADDAAAAESVGLVPAEGESAACLSGGTDDLSPLQFWANIMKKYNTQKVPCMR